MPRRTRLQRFLDEELQELLQLAQDHDLAELEVEHGGLRLRLSRDSSGNLEFSHEGDPPAELASDPSFWLSAPIIGHFYFEGPLAPGQVISTGQRLGHIDTLDLITEVVVDTNAEVVEVLAEEGQVVEYGQALFALRRQQTGD